MWGNSLPSSSRELGRESALVADTPNPWKCEFFVPSVPTVNNRHLVQTWHYLKKSTDSHAEEEVVVWSG